MTDERRKEARRIMESYTGLADVFDCHIDAMLAFAAEAVAAERARYSSLEITPPNSDGKTLCMVRWMAETPHGWIGAWDKSALQNVKTVEQEPT